MDKQAKQEAWAKIKTTFHWLDDRLDVAMSALWFGIGVAALTQTRHWPIAIFFWMPGLLHLRVYFHQKRIRSLIKISVLLTEFSDFLTNQNPTIKHDENFKQHMKEINQWLTNDKSIRFL